MTLARATEVMVRLHRALEDHLEIARSLPAILPSVAHLADLLVGCLTTGGCVYTFGNGGSAADAQHFAGEIIGRYRRDRAPLASVCLAADVAVLTCIANDFGFEEVFARQVLALARPGDIVIGFSSTGRSANVVRGLSAAQSVGAMSVLFASGDGCPAAAHADLTLLVLDKGTARVQESHQLLMHMLSEVIDEHAGAVAPTASPVIEVTTERLTS